MTSRSVVVSVAAVLGLTGVANAQLQPCISDITGDRVVDGSDLASVLAAWDQTESPANIDRSPASPTVDGQDLAFVLSAWGICPVTVPSWATLVEAHPDPAVVFDENLRASIVATGYAWRVRDTATQIEMVLIPPGTFQMGCSASNVYPECNWTETPVHQVTLTNAFYMGRYEVTQAQWTSVMGVNPSHFQNPSAQVPAEQVPSRPVERVSWNTIQGFLSATGMRLPTEAEWEYAYRAGTTTAFHSMPGYPNGVSDDLLLQNIAWFDANSASQTRPVGQLAANGFGLHDMAGNVMEWVNDWFGSYSSAAQVNPSGPSSGVLRVVRSGGWSNSSIYSRAGFRGDFVPSGIDNNCGFRVARNP